MGVSSSRVTSPRINSPHGKFIQQLIAENCVVVFSKTTCPYCTQAKDILRGMKVDHHVVELNHHPEGSEIQSVLAEMTNARTVPRVFINGTCVGGASDVKSLYKTGKLIDLVNECNITASDVKQ
ncbi:hypothetical protein FSP39_015069 [Pinctada imbricata]|uniref:Glutaredoxin-2, mitochondrial n=1 Tax=Pinctada imbricata TaxID=66713 RepID=A0AA89C7P9_PINIB|nr:hypothetical protein FSP39_015069 [Pinctada imbricata]